MGEDSEELLEYATDAARRDVIGKEQVGKDLARMSRERVLLRVEILEKVTRCEAHISLELYKVGLYKALHQLKALRTRNLGGSAPVACLDVDRLSGMLKLPNKLSGSPASFGWESGLEQMNGPELLGSNPLFSPEVHVYPALLHIVIGVWRRRVLRRADSPHRVSLMRRAAYGFPRRPFF
jgi:hypothetical protein